MIPETYMEEENNCFLQVVLCPAHVCHSTYRHVHAHILNKQIRNNKCKIYHLYFQSTFCFLYRVYLISDGKNSGKPQNKRNTRARGFTVMPLSPQCSVADCLLSAVVGTTTQRVPARTFRLRKKMHFKGYYNL